MKVGMGSTAPIFILKHLRLPNVKESFMQAEAYAASVQASDEAAHVWVVEICSPALNDRVLDVACGPSKNRVKTR